MAKFYEADDEMQNLVHEVAAELNLENFMDFEAICVPKAKEIVSVTRASKMTEFLSNRSDLIIVIFFQEIFDQFDEKTKYMFVRMAMDQISYDSEHDKINIGCPMINVPVGFYQKYEKAAVDTALLGQISIAQWEDKKKQEKEEKKALKTKKQKQ